MPAGSSRLQTTSPPAQSPFCDPSPGSFPLKYASCSVSWENLPGMCSDPKGWLASDGHFGLRARYSKVAVPKLFGTRDSFRGRRTGCGEGGAGDGFGMIQAHYIYCALYFSFYYICSTSDHQALDPRGWLDNQSPVGNQLFHLQIKPASGGCQSSPSTQPSPGTQGPEMADTERAVRMGLGSPRAKSAVWSWTGG